MSDEKPVAEGGHGHTIKVFENRVVIKYNIFKSVTIPCLLYTSDAADERSSVDLGGRRIIKKKKNVEEGSHRARAHTYYRNRCINNVMTMIAQMTSKNDQHHVIR